jgi:hypothetical protein
MLKEKFKDEDPYSEIRRPVPPSSYPYGIGKEYDKSRNRKKEKDLILKELEEMGDELNENIEIL